MLSTCIPARIQTMTGKKKSDPCLAGSAEIGVYAVEEGNRGGGVHNTRSSGTPFSQPLASRAPLRSHHPRPSNPHSHELFADRHGYGELSTVQAQPVWFDGLDDTRCGFHSDHPLHADDGIRVRHSTLAGGWADQKVLDVLLVRARRLTERLDFEGPAHLQNRTLHS